MDEILAKIGHKTTPPPTDAVESVLQAAPGKRLTEDIGLSSLDRIELMGRLEDQLNISLDEGAFASATTVGELRNLIENPQASERGVRAIAIPGGFPFLSCARPS